MPSVLVKPLRLPLTRIPAGDAFYSHHTEKRAQYTRRFVNVTLTPGGKRQM